MLYRRFCSAWIWPTLLCSLYCPLSDSPFIYPRLGDKGLPILMGLCRGLRLNACGLWAFELSFGEPGLFWDWCVWLFAFKRICWLQVDGCITCKKETIYIKVFLLFLQKNFIKIYFISKLCYVILCCHINYKYRLSRVNWTISIIYLLLRLRLLYAGSLHGLNRNWSRNMLRSRYLRRWGWGNNGLCGVRKQYNVQKYNIMRIATMDFTGKHIQIKIAKYSESKLIFWSLSTLIIQFSIYLHEKQSL